MFRSYAIRVALISVLLAFAFMGSRGLWEPDEGRYTNVALQMLRSGDFLDLSRHHETGHWTKPPGTYWALAGSVSVFGRNTAAVRLPVALSYLISIALCAWIARRVQPGTEAASALIYATMALPFGAANVITTDYLLAAFQGLAMAAWIESRFNLRSTAPRWLLLMGAAFAAAFLIKGPPALIPLLAVFALKWLAPALAPRRNAYGVLSALLFAAIALPWFVAVIQRHPGLLGYYLGTEIADRVAGASLNRHPQWYGWLLVYGITLTAGTLPWTLDLGRAVRSLTTRVREWRSAEARRRDAGLLAIVAWIVLPLLLFCIARSRLPLYILPLFLPIALLIARSRSERGHASINWRFIGVWVAILLAVRFGTAHWTTRSDSRRWAAEIAARSGDKSIEEICFVEDMPRYGLNLYLDVEVEKVSLNPEPKPALSAPWDGDFASELHEPEERMWITKERNWSNIVEIANAEQYRIEPLGAPFEGRIFFLVHPD